MRIEISQKIIESLHKELTDYDENDLGIPKRDELIDLWLKTHDPQKFAALIEELSQQNYWRSIRFDLSVWYEIFNIVDDILLSIYKGFTILTGQMVPQQELDEKTKQAAPLVTLLLKFLKSGLHTATNVHFFSSTDTLLLTYEMFEFDFTVRDELLSVLATISAKKNDKTLKNIVALSKDHLLFARFDDQITPLINNELIIYLRHIDYLGDFLLQSNQINSNLEAPATYFEKLIQEEKVKERVQVLKRLQRINSQSEGEEAFIIGMKAMHIYLNVGDLSVEGKDSEINQTQLLEKLLRPKPTVSKFINILKNPHLSKKVHCQVLNNLLQLILLDLIQMYGYNSPQENQYYVEACSYYEYYIKTLQQLANYHTYEKLRVSYNSQKPFMANVFEALIQMQQILGLEEESKATNQEDAQSLSESMKSQRFMNSFFNFMGDLLSIKNKTLQNHLYPLFLKPLLAIVSLKPIGGLYHININCQVKAAKILKDVCKQASIDDVGAVENIISKLKFEIKALDSSNDQWVRSKDDDTDSAFNMLSYRQDLIRTLLRFLAYSIIRNDPNAINFTQNFIANSRKILDSNLIQEDLMIQVFNKNLEQIDSSVPKIIDPVILQSVQLVSYVFNDLPQKLPAFIESGDCQKILMCLRQRIPLTQPDLLSILLKFIQTLCLNQQGSELLIQSELFQTIADATLDSKAYRQFVNPSKAMALKDMIQNIAFNNKNVAKQMITIFVRNLLKLKEKAWIITKDYIEMEENCKQDVEGESIVEKEKRVKDLRNAYEKKQIRMEQIAESASSLLWCIVTEEQMFLQDNFIHQALDENIDEIIEVFKQIIFTPLIASACTNMIPAFIEMLQQILQGYGEGEEVEFMVWLLKALNLQIKNVKIALKQDDLDQISDFEGKLTQQESEMMVLDEYYYLRQEGSISQEQQEVQRRLTGEDALSVVFAKISFYCEIIKRSGNEIKVLICKNSDTDNGLDETIYDLFKIQAMINRYHASKYERDLIKQINSISQLLPYPEIENVDYSNFVPYVNPQNPIEEHKNQYYQFLYKDIKSLTDERARKNNKTIIELTLDENLSHTSNICQLSIRKLIVSMLRMRNKQRIHFSEKVKASTLEYNKEIGKLIAIQFEDFLKIPKDQATDTEIMRYCCQFSAMFSEFTKILFQHNSYGSMFIAFVSNQGISHVNTLVLWLIKYQYYLEQRKELLNYNLCRTIQLLWSHLIDFYAQLFETRYFDQQFNQFIISFKKDPCSEISQDDQQTEFDQALGKMQKYFYGLFTEVAHFLYYEINQLEVVSRFIPGKEISSFEYFNLSSELFFQSYVEIYYLVTKGYNHCKIFNPIGLNPSKQPTKAKANTYQVNQQQVQILVEMGYEQQLVEETLRLVDGDLNEALDILMNQPYPRQNPSVEQQNQQQQQDQQAQAQQNPSQGIQDLIQQNPQVQAFMSLFEDKGQFHQDIKYGTKDINDLYLIIESSIGEFIRFLPLKPSQVEKKETLDNIFFILGKDYKNTETMNFLKKIMVTILNSITECLINKEALSVGILSYGLTCLLSFQRGVLVNFKEVFQAVFEIIAIFQQATQEFKKSIDAKATSGDLKQLSFIMQNLQQSLALFLYISEEAKIKCDINKLDLLLHSQEKQQQKESLKELESEITKIQLENESNIFYVNKEQTAEILQKVTLMLIDVFKAMNNISDSLDYNQYYLVIDLVKKSIENLNFMINIKGYGEFDGQTCFLQNEGLRALFGIRTLFKENKAIPLNKENNKFNELMLQSKILMQLLSSNESTQVRIYENLIKSILFIQFQEVYKKQEGSDIKSLFNIEDFKQQATSQLQPKPSIQSQSKKKKSFTSPTQNPVQEERFLAQSEDKGAHTTVKNQGKNLNQLLYKKQEYGEVSLAEFISLFNHVLQIQDLKSFLIASQNVCLIKQKPLKPQAKTLKFEEEVKEQQQQPTDKILESQIQQEKWNNKDFFQQITRQSKRIKKNLQDLESKDQKQEKGQEEQEVQLMIHLNKQILKEMVIQYGQQLQSQLGFSIGIEAEKQFSQQKNVIQKFQQDVVFTFLDLFIDQIRDQQMIILQSCKQKENPSTFGIKTNLNEDQSLNVKDPNGKIERTQYLFDFTSILGHLTYVFTHNPSLIQSLIKHKEGKTYTFIIRNIYYLLTFGIEPALPPKDSDQMNEHDLYQVSIQDQKISKKRQEQVIEFFKRVLLDNPHLTPQEKKLKQETRAIFIKEIVKNMSESKYTNKYPQWAQLGLVFTIGAAWLVANILKDEDKVESNPNHDENYDQIINCMQKFRNVMRHQMIKQLICESQHLKQQEQHQFTLLKNIERIQQDILKNIDFFAHSQNNTMLCIQTLSNVLKPFANNKNIWGDKEQEKSSILGESNLGFVAQDNVPSVIDEEMIEEDEEDEEEMSSESSESQENEDEDLLDSERSERNFRFSENEEDQDIDEEYGEEDDDDDEDDEEGSQSENEGENDEGSSGFDADPILENLIGMLERESENEADDDYYPEEANDRQVAQRSSQAQSQGRQEQADNQQEENKNQWQRQNEGEQDDDYGEDDYNSEEIAGSEDYYDEEDEEEEAEEEDEEDEQEIEIHLGRGAHNLDRLSNIELGAAQRHRRDEIMSMNNMSIDFFHMHDMGMGRAAHAIQEEQESVDFSDADHENHVPQGRIGRAAPGHQAHLLNLIDHLNRSFRHRNQGQNLQSTMIEMIQEKIASHSSLIHSPLEVLTNILEISRSLQESPDIYRMFIKEHIDPALLNTANQPSYQTNNQVQSNQQEIEIRNRPNIQGAASDIATSTKSQNSSSHRQQAGFAQQEAAVQINTAIIDEQDIDPEFLEALDQEGMMNLAQTENVINRIRTQNQQQQEINQKPIQNTVDLLQSISLSTEQRNEIYRNLTEEAFYQLPPNLYAEGLSQRPNQRANQHNPLQPSLQLQNPFNINLINQLRPAGPNAMLLRINNNQRRGGRAINQQPNRERLMSMDSQLNDLTDFSRGANDPFFRNPNMINLARQPNNVMNQVKVSFNSILANFVQHLKDLVPEIENQVITDSKGQDAQKLSEQIIQQSLIQTGDNLEQNSTKVSGLITLVTVWFKFQKNSSGSLMFQRDSIFLKILLKIPLLRIGVLVQIYSWFLQGVQSFASFCQKHNTPQPNDKKFQVLFGSGIPGSMAMMDFLIQGLKCFRVIQQESCKISFQYCQDFLKSPLSQDPIFKFMINQENALMKQENPNAPMLINLDQNLLEQIVEQIVVFAKIIAERPNSPEVQDYTIDGAEVWMENIIETTGAIIQQLSFALENQQRQQSQEQQNKAQPPVFNMRINEKTINLLGDIFLTKEFKEKENIMTIRNIFADISSINEKDGSIDVFFKSRLSNSLMKIIKLIDLKKHGRINSEKLKKEVVILGQVLKISRSKKKTQETNICDQNMFFHLVENTSNLIKSKNLDNSNLATQASYIFGDEFRTIMIALFIIFEYNLKFVFTDSQDELNIFQQPPRRRGGQNQQNQRRNQQQQQQQQALTEVLMEDIHWEKTPINVPPAISKENYNLMEAIVNHIKSKIKDPKAREDQSLMLFTKFCMEHKRFINSFIRANQQVLNESLRNVIMKVPQVLDFDNKRLLFRGYIKKLQKKFKLKYIDLQVRRENVFEDSYEQLRMMAPDSWRGQLNVEFSGEQGIDEGGITREWFILLSQQIFNPDLALFIQSNSGSTYYPNPKSDVEQDHLQLFKFIGRIVGKAVYEQQLLDCYFVKALYKILLGMPLNYHDVEDFDNELYKNLKWVLENSVEGHGFYFTETIDYFGETKEVEIVEGGNQLEVTEENKKEYVQRMAYRKLYTSIKVQVDSFLKGFYDVVPKALIQIFDNRELELLISGLPSIDIMDLKENTIYQNYSSESQVIKWLFEVLEEFENSERAEFIQFVTGSSKVPVEGFKGLRGSRGIQKFQVVKFFTDDYNRLPQAHTCFNQLELPEYQSKEQLKERLLSAIKEGKTFGFA